MPRNPFAEGLRFPPIAPSSTVVIFGATGDLTRRKLVPALASLHAKGYAPDLEVIGFARRPWSDGSFRDEMAKALPSLDKEFLARFSYIRADFADPAGYEALRPRLAPGRVAVFYLATPPESYEPIIEGLGRSGLAAMDRARIVVEKPFGRDAGSAAALDASLHRRFPESRIYRIDHYVGKETVQNLAMLRFGNAVMEPVFNASHVAAVEITVAERVGLEGRGGYYERAGALRDMVQNHLLQLLATSAMEPPNDLKPDSIRTEKVKVLRALKPISKAELPLAAVRGQYTAGFIDGAQVPGYLEEPGVAEGSTTETYVALALKVENWRWSGVPFYVRTGKRLPRRLSEIVFHFKRPPLSLFGEPGPAANSLAIRIQPDEGISLTINTKAPGQGARPRKVNMDFLYGSSFGEALPEAYERLLFDALTGDSTLFTRSDEIEASWEWIMPVLEGFEEGLCPLLRYRAGSPGPAEASAIGGGYAWRRI
jgi:glucose-6-phosphate 1-dehydrogenase